MASKTQNERPTWADCQAAAIHKPNIVRGSCGCRGRTDGESHSLAAAAGVKCRAARMQCVRNWCFLLPTPYNFSGTLSFAMVCAGRYLASAKIPTAIHHPFFCCAAAWAGNTDPAAPTTAGWLSCRRSARPGQSSKERHIHQCRRRRHYYDMRHERFRPETAGPTERPSSGTTLTQICQVGNARRRNASPLAFAQLPVGARRARGARARRRYGGGAARRPAASGFDLLCAPMTRRASFRPLPLSPPQLVLATPARRATAFRISCRTWCGREVRNTTARSLLKKALRGVPLSLLSSTTSFRAQYSSHATTGVNVRRCNG